MGLDNRPYMTKDSDGRPGGGLTVGLPPIGRVVKYLLGINLAVFLLQVFFDAPSRVGVGPMSLMFGANVTGWWQVWRYVTFQFLHASYDYWHILMNMLGLYILGSPLEQHWGPRRFLGFYLGCGAFAGAAYVAVSAVVGADRYMPIIGASGGVYAILLACAVLFPQFKIIFLFFPVPIRLAALIIFGGMVFIILSSLRPGQLSPQFWSDTAHLGGAAAAAFSLWVLPAIGEARASWSTRDTNKTGLGAWKRRMDRLASQQAQIDRILQKIHNKGLNSLSRKERKILKNATRQQQAQEQEQYKS